MGRAVLDMNGATLMLNLILAISLISNLAIVGEAGPPASYDKPDSAREGTAVEDRAASDFERGEYLPIQYRGDLVKNWKKAGLRKPDTGFEWVKVAQLAFLINPTSGFIRDIVELED
ncbi:hypothetical protein D1222_05270 [Henriciella algicola]|uniref:Uncharacterized protein n=2 Tax=Henriciella algicola TaxID=1608422 RepID=A0A399RMW9_9PROT|nr:hypothetical protein D1222_05270 [Henriciella algicola]